MKQQWRNQETKVIEKWKATLWEAVLLRAPSQYAFSDRQRQVCQGREENVLSSNLDKAVNRQNLTIEKQNKHLAKAGREVQSAGDKSREDSDPSLCQQAD